MNVILERLVVYNKSTELTISSSPITYSFELMNSQEKSFFTLSRAPCFASMEPILHAIIHEDF